MDNSVTNRKYGRLTVLRLDGVDDSGVMWVQVRCDCGVEKRIRRMALGRSRSCGCERRERSRAIDAKRVPRRRSGIPKAVAVPVHADALQGLLEANSSLLDPETVQAMAARPRTRADCVGGQRPCPWVGCRHHLYLDVTPAGSLKLNWPALEPDELEHSCSLDVAEEEQTLDLVGRLMNLTRERVRQIVLDVAPGLRGKLAP